MALEHQSDRQSPKGDLLEYFTLLLAWRRFILVFVGGVTVAALVVSLLLPKWYRSSATLIPPKDNSTIGGLGGLSTLLKEVAPGMSARLGSQSSAYNYLAILKSRRAAEAVIYRFDLSRVYDISEGSMEKTLKEFAGNFDVEVTSDGTLVIEILDRDSTRAAAITNFIVETLNTISIELGTGEARSNREFLEKRVDDTRSDLKAAEERFREFQERNGLVILPDDAKSTASAIGDLYARKVRIEIELALLKKSTGTSNTAYVQLENEKEELARQLGRFPNLGVQSYRLYRDLLIQQKILEFLIPLYEQARVEEHRDIPVMLVLDRAVPAERKARPMRLMIIGIAFLSSLILAVAIILITLRVRVFRAEHPTRYRDLVSAARGRHHGE